MVRAVLLVIGLVTAGLVVAPSDATYTGTTNPTASLASAGGYSYSAAVVAATPWAYWRFDETSGTTVADSSGNARTLTLSGTGSTRGIDGAVLQDTSRAIEFDGVSGCAVSSTTHSNPNPMTIEVWFRTTTTDGGLIVGFGGTSPAASGVYGYDRQLFLRTDGRIAFGTSPSGNNTMTSPGAYNDGRWHLVHVTAAGGGNWMYVDGAAVSSGTGGASGTTNSWHIGCGTVHNGFVNAPTSGYLAAEIDEVAIYGSALSANTIADRWRTVPHRTPYARAVTGALPWAYWPLGQGSGGSMPDASGNGRNGTSSATGLSGYQNGPAHGGSATAFDGSAGCTVSQTSHANPQTFTVAGWFRTTSTSGGVLIQLSDQAAALGTGATDRDRHVYMNAAGLVSFGALNGPTRVVVDSVTGGYNDGAWHHVAATLGPAGQVLYLDGEMVDSDPNTTAQGFTGWWHLGCGSMSVAWPNAPAGAYWAGSLDDWTVFPYALDASTVSAHFRAGATGLSYTDTVAASSPALWWRMEPTPSRQVPDASGNGRTAAVSDGGVQWGTRGVVPGDGAATFDGSRGCIGSIATMVSPTPFSIEAWFRTTATSEGWIAGFTSSAAPDVANPWSHDRILYTRADGRLTFGVYPGSVQTITSTASYNDGRWHHAVATNGPSGTMLYVDGAPVASGGSTTAEGTTNYWHVGCGYFNGLWPAGPQNSYFAGDIDEVAIYTSALTPVAIEAHWRAANNAMAADAARAQSPVWASWNLDEQTGTTLADSSGNSRTATASATGITYGTAGVTGDDTALTFDGSTGCTVSTASISDMNPFSVEAWFRTTTTSGGPIFQMNGQSGFSLPGASYDRHVYMENNGRVRFGAFPGSQQTVVSTASYNDGQWHQAVGTLGPDGLAFYLDGALIGTLPAVTTAASYLGYWHLGCGTVGPWPGTTSSDYFAGSIDEVTIFSNQLDAATVAYRYALMTGRAASPTVNHGSPTPSIWWRFDETSGTAQDSSGNGVTGSAPSSGLTRGVAGAVPGGTGWAFDGTSTPCVTASSTYVNPTSFTIETWFRTRSTQGAGIMSFTNNTDPFWATKYDRHVYMRDSGVLSFGVNPGSNQIITSSATYNDGRWHHVAATLGADGQRLYVDGSLVASGAATSAESYTGQWHVGCGKHSFWTGDPSNDYLNGAVDEFVFTQRQLSPSAIRSRYLAGLTRRTAELSGTSTVATVTGNGTATSTGDGGPMGSATVNQPTGIVVDQAGNTYVAERSCRIRRIAANGVISTYAGNGTCTNTGDGGPATSATLSDIESLALGPDGSLYVVVGDANKVRRISPSGTITTFAGTGAYSSTGDGGAATAATLMYPVGVAVDSSNQVYISEFDAHRVRKVNTAGVISTVLGTGSFGFSGDGGPGTSATVDGPGQLAVGQDGSLYVSDYWNCRIRRLATSGTVTTYAGNGSCSHSGDGGNAVSAAFSAPTGLAIDPVGTLYISARGSNRVRRVAPNGIISTILGTGTASSSGDGGPGTSATVNSPYSLAIDGAGRLVITEELGNRVRRLG